MKSKKERKGDFYFFAFLVYVYVANAMLANITAKMIAVADESSFIFGVGVGSVTVLLVGMKNACRAQVVALTLYASVLVV